MAKTNNNTGATMAGFTGIVQHAAPLADGRTLSELDPERNLDGSPIAGRHAAVEEGEREQRPTGEAPAPKHLRHEAQPVDEPAEHEPVEIEPAGHEDAAKRGAKNRTARK